MAKKAKQFWKSKTFWWSALLFFGAVSSAVGGELQTTGTLTVIGVVNLVIRKYTDSPIKWEL